MTIWRRKRSCNIPFNCHLGARQNLHSAAFSFDVQKSDDPTDWSIVQVRFVAARCMRTTQIPTQITMTIIVANVLPSAILIAFCCSSSLDWNRCDDWERIQFPSIRARLVPSELGNMVGKFPLCNRGPSLSSDGENSIYDNESTNNWHTGANLSNPSSKMHAKRK